MAKKETDKHHVRSLTASQRMFVDQLVSRFGEAHTNVKRADLKKAAQEILSTATVPGWITRNKAVRSKSIRGRYNLAVLLKLPIDAFGDTPKGKKKTTKKKTVEKPVEDAKVTRTETVDVPASEKPKKVKSVTLKEALREVFSAMPEFPVTLSEE